ncbi:Pre-mRNA-splicing factor of RES complex-domain-containing protein [Lipomyces oligophaga]|uniref:Pre-mRNA-splicing factor of RES complex-domain-containing protein n=1 Tax=Lipomyces oligophaga TaxID=45792 RepID=UPI0034CFA1F5
MSRLDYLASKYLIAEGPPKKRKKTKTSKSSKEIVIEDEPGWTDPKDSDQDEIGEDAPVVENVSVRPIVVSAGWKKVGHSVDSKYPGDSENLADSTVASESNPASDALVVPEEPVRRIGGLKSGKTVKAELDRRKAYEFARMEASGTSGKNSAVVYRDASGKKIDIEAYKAKMQLQLEAEQRKIREDEERQVELNRGVVQQLDAKRALEQEREQESSSTTSLKISQYADDKELNDNLKQQQLWEDPAAKFLTSQKSERKSVSGLKLYQGPYPPNRFNIPPGYRWDGVDRSNGFEVRVLEKRSKVRERVEDAYESDGEE